MSSRSFIFSVWAVALVVLLASAVALFSGPNGPLSAPLSAEALAQCPSEDGQFNGTITWDNTCIHVITKVFMEGGSTLIIEPGTIVKMKTPVAVNDTNIILDGAHLIALGTASEPILITSYNDDFAGDTNGSAVPPAPGDWESIMVTNDGHGNDGTIDMTYVTVKYGGSCRAMITNQYTDGTCQQYVNAGTVTEIDHSSVVCSATDGIHMDNGANLTISDSSILGNIGFGIFNDSSAPQADADDNWWGSASGPGGAGPGSGDEVSSNVDFTPWLTSAPPSQLSTNCAGSTVASGPGSGGVGGSIELSTMSNPGSNGWIPVAMALGVAVAATVGAAALGWLRLRARF